MTTRQVRDRLVRVLREYGFPDVITVVAADDDRLQISVRIIGEGSETWEVRVRKVEGE